MNTRALFVVGGALGVAGLVASSRAKKPSDPFAQALPTCAGAGDAAASSAGVGAGLPATCLPACGNAFADVAEVERRRAGAAPSCGLSPDWHDNTAADNFTHDLTALGDVAWNAGTAGGLENLSKARDALKKLVADNIVTLLVIAGVAVVGFVAFERVTHA